MTNSTSLEPTSLNSIFLALYILWTKKRKVVPLVKGNQLTCVGLPCPCISYGLPM